MEESINSMKKTLEGITANIGKVFLWVIFWIGVIVFCRFQPESLICTLVSVCSIAMLFWKLVDLGVWIGRGHACKVMLKEIEKHVSAPSPRKNEGGKDE